MTTDESSQQIAHRSSPRLTRKEIDELVERYTGDSDVSMSETAAEAAERHERTNNGQ